MRYSSIPFCEVIPYLKKMEQHQIDLILSLGSLSLSLSLKKLGG